MAKKPIYLDEREIDLAYRVLTAARNELAKDADLRGDRWEKLALSWTRDEITSLAHKFEPSRVQIAAMPLPKAAS